MKIGNKEDAKLIYRRRKTGAGPLPKGWRKLGEGSYRTVYLSPTNVVYKICQNPKGQSNIQEFNFYTKMRKAKRRLPKDWRIAHTKLYSFRHDENDVDIIAMEYIIGKHVAYADFETKEWNVSRAFAALGLNDVHEGNFVLTARGKKVIIDLGE